MIDIKNVPDEVLKEIHKNLETLNTITVAQALALVCRVIGPDRVAQGSDEILAGMTANGYSLQEIAASCLNMFATITLVLDLSARKKIDDVGKLINEVMKRHAN